MSDKIKCLFTFREISIVCILMSAFMFGLCLRMQRNNWCCSDQHTLVIILTQSQSYRLHFKWCSFWWWNLKPFFLHYAWTWFCLTKFWCKDDVQPRSGLVPVITRCIATQSVLLVWMRGIYHRDKAQVSSIMFVGYFHHPVKPGWSHTARRWLETHHQPSEIHTFTKNLGCLCILKELFDVYNGKWKWLNSSF